MVVWRGLVRSIAWYLVKLQGVVMTYIITSSPEKLRVMSHFLQRHMQRHVLVPMSMKRIRNGEYETTSTLAR